MVVDSHRDAASKQPVALSYLAGLGVNPATAVDVVVATHWHDDHVRGLSRVLAAAPNARFVASGAWEGKQFLRVVEYMRQRSFRTAAQRDQLILADAGRPSGVGEMGAVLDRLQSRGQRPVWALEDRLIWPRTDAPRAPVTVTAVAPSDDTVLRSQAAFAELRRELPLIDAIPLPKPNDCSLALWVRTPHLAVLLGGDLVDVPNDAGRGWSAVVDASTTAPGLVSMFKLAHHGAKSGDNEIAWDILTSMDGCVAAMTAFTSQKDPLPTNEDRQRILGRTDEAYAAGTRIIEIDTESPRGRVVARRRRKRQAETGQVRLRRPLDAPAGTPWEVTCSGNAGRLSVT
ncbi:hypothetical protein [Baekduia sp. Peel2402]|uniref:hypothetical protein n=1 Tax=Baekduia sp. Peel2402 TaxID=3458296 RepID=UPI00403E6067